MRKTLLLLFVLSAFSMQAQKIKQLSGDLSFLKGQKNIQLEFLYSDNLKVGKMTEADYIKKKQAEAEKAEAGGGEKWLEKWKADRTEHYQPKFIELMNAYLEKPGVTVSEDRGDAKYKLVVTTTFIEPGYNVGVSHGSAYINLELKFVEIDSGKDMASFTMTKSPGTGAWDYDSGYRIGEAYAKAGKEFAKFLLKKKAF